MTITEKFNNLTQEQREKFFAFKDSAELDLFLSETGIEITPDEKAQVLEYMNPGMLPLADEELENVAGGACFGTYVCPNVICYRRNKKFTNCICGTRVCKRCGLPLYGHPLCTPDRCGN